MQHSMRLMVVSPVLYSCDDGIVLIAGGVGITPMLSILRYYSETKKDQKIMLIWGLKKHTDMICEDDFISYQKVMPNFSFIPVLSSDPDFSGEKGHITPDLMQRKIDENGLAISKLHFFFCGPPLMWPGISESLTAMQIKQCMIHRENFSL